MKWFKHYNEASEGHSISELLSEKDYESIAIYWWLLEQVSRFEQPESRGEVTLKFSYFRMKLGQNQQRFTKVLSKIGQTFKIKVEINLDETVTLSIPNWLELQENRGGKREPNDLAKTEQKTTELRSKKLEVRSKKKEEEYNTTSEPQAVAVVNSSLFIISSTQQIPIKHELVKSWADTYPKEFLQASFKEMRNWVLSNQQKAPKSNWTRFMNNWFARGWERHRTTIKSNPTQITADDLNEILRGE